MQPHPSLNIQKGIVMNWSQIEGNWMQLKGKAREQWGKLTDGQLDVISGKRDQLAGKIQEVYGMTKDDVDKQICAWQNMQNPENVEDKEKKSH
jgi:uncharacterized protein YjbJ (UPF0337 family)